MGSCPKNVMTQNLIARTFTTFDPIIPNEYVEYYGVIFLLLPLWGSSKFWLRYNCFSNIRILIYNLRHQISIGTRGVFVAGFKYSIFIFFLFVLIINLWGLVPYTFPPTRHISITFSLAILVWGSMIGLSILNVKSTLAENLPKERGLLSVFLVIVEVVRSLIRPITLSFRLAANITAGHVILGLICTGCQQIFTIGFLTAFIIPSMYTMFEIAVCFAQAYVFVLLVNIYRNNYVFWWNKLSKLQDS